MVAQERDAGVGLAAASGGGRRAALLAFGTSAPPEFTFAYNKVGQQTSDGEYETVFDVWGRLRFIRYASAPVVEYRYNAMGFLIAESSYAASGDPPVAGPWTYFCYDERWRVHATFEEDDEMPRRHYVYHNAGRGGYGGSSYIDSLILRDRRTGDATVLNERRYYCQNWRADVSAILTHDGKMVEWVKYSAYGEPTSIPAGDTDGDYDWDATDSANISGSVAYEVRQDTNLDGVVNASDVTHATSITGGYQALGRGVLSSVGVESRVGYAGYRYDPHLGSTGRHWYPARHRWYMAEVGRWMTRDPLGYIAGMSLYEYVYSRPVIMVDVFGLLPSRLASREEKGGRGGELTARRQIKRSQSVIQQIPLVVFKGCPPGVLSCLGEYLKDPAVKETLYELAICMGHRGIGQIEVECDTNCDSSTPPGNKLRMTVCDFNARCNAMNKSTFLHELIHVRQSCEQKRRWYGTCDDAICAELEAYANETGTPYGGAITNMCGSACGSAESSCAGGRAACEARCKSIAGWCMRGQYAPPTDKTPYQPRPWERVVPPPCEPGLVF
jgi:RHS repeat-associated protein